MAGRKRFKTHVFTARDASGKAISKRFSSLDDGRAWQEKIRRERQLIRSGMEAPLSITPMTVQEYAARYIQRRAAGVVLGKYRGKRRTPATKGYWMGEEQRLRDYILPEVGGRLLSAIKAEEWEQVFDRIKLKPRRKDLTGGQLSEATMNRIRAMMSRLYEDAKIERVVTANPISETASRDEGDPAEKIKYWSTEECGRYLAEAYEEGPAFFCWAVWALNTGGRVNELLAVEKQDVHLDNGFILIRQIVDVHDDHKVRERTKGKKSRVVGMNRSMIEAYQELQEKAPSQIYVFERAEDTTPQRYHDVRKKHLRVCAAARVRPLTVHQLRHTYASQFMMAGGSLSDLAAVLGHSNLTTPQRYARFSRDHLKKQSGIFEVGKPKN